MRCYNLDLLSLANSSEGEHRTSNFQLPTIERAINELLSIGHGLSVGVVNT